MNKSQKLLELFDKPEATVSYLDKIGKKYSVEVSKVRRGNHRLFIQVNWLDKDQLGRTDRFLDAVISKGLASNVYAVNTRGDYVQKASVGNTKKFTTGFFDKPFNELN